MAKTTCLGCGQAIECNPVGPFAGAEVVGALCTACIDRRFLEGGGCVLTLHRELEGSRFSLGKITITPGAVEALGDSGQHAAAFLLRHTCGDWGACGHCDQIELTADERRRGWEATEDTAKINKSNLLNCRDRIMSECRTERGKRLWVITSLDEGGGTTVLLPEEY
jgi:hypothetical protein